MSAINNINNINNLSMDKPSSTNMMRTNIRNKEEPIITENSISKSNDKNITQTRKRNVFDVLKTLKQNNESNKKTSNILVRVDFNVPMSSSQQDNHTTQTISDDSRIRASIHTLKEITSSKCNAIIISHMGRPKMVQDPKAHPEKRIEQKNKLSLRPAAERLSQLMNMKVGFVSDCIGEDVEKAIDDFPKEGGGLLVLENLRFYKEEEKNDEEFARSLASFADAYINDAFGTCHRAHASVSGVPKLLPSQLCGVGCLVNSEISYLDFDSSEEGETISAVIGGSKVSTKLPIIKSLLDRVDTLVLGGGLAFTFLKANGISVGNSLVEDSMIDTAKELMASAKARGKSIVLPVDAVCAKSFPTSPMRYDDTMTFDLTPGGGGIEDGWAGFDVGPNTLVVFRESLFGAAKLVFNGPMGVFEMPPFDEGTRGLVQIIEDATKHGTVTVVGGGDSIAALEAFEKSDVVSYASTGGGATLELLGGKVLPGVAAISDVGC